jgi:hypothetical protein
MRIGIFGNTTTPALKAAAALVVACGSSPCWRSDRHYRSNDHLEHFDAVVVDLDSLTHAPVADAYDHAGVPLFFVEGASEALPSELYRFFGIDSDAPLREREDAAMGRQLVAILLSHAGERGVSEGAVETLHRIIAERDLFEKAEHARKRPGRNVKPAYVDAAPTE